MKVQGVLPCLPPLLLIISLHTRAEEQGEARGEQDTARIFPLLPPYQSVDFAANFNKLKSSGDAAYFVVRDSTVFIAVNVFWAVVHYLIWDGKASTKEDVIASILSPGVQVELSEPDKNSRLFSLESFSELSATKLWNFFTDPNPSTRNLYLNIGFAAFSHVLWILPTFLGIIPSTGRQDSRLDSSVPGIPSNLAEADPVALWNRLLSPQGVLQMMAINTLNYFGKLLFWTFMSVVPDAGAGRSLGGQHAWLAQVAEGFTDNVLEALNEPLWVKQG